MLSKSFLIALLLALPMVAASQNGGQQSLPRYHTDSFTFTTLEDQKPILDHFASDLQANPSLRGYVLAYGGRQSCRDEAKLVLRLIKDYLVRRHNIDERRIITFDGGYRERTTYEIWRVPPGLEVASVPIVDPRDVQFLSANHPRCRSLRAATRNRRRA